MEQNPYQPSQLPEYRSTALGAVSGPAIGLLVVAITCVVFALIAIGMDIFLLASGLAAIVSERTGESEERNAFFRMGWSALLLVCSGFIICGSLKMRRLESYSVAYTSAVVAAVPCVGPCCLLGIPFGIWAIVVLNRPDVRSAFRS